MNSCQWHFPPKVGAVGELISKTSLPPKICKWGKAFLLTAHCLALPKVHSSHSLNIPMTWILRAFVVDLVMTSDGWPNSIYRLLMFCLMRAVAETALWLMEFHRKLTPANQPSRVLIWRSNMISPLGVFTMMLLNLLLEILFPCESLHVREKLFHLPKHKTSQAKEYGPVCLHSLVILLLVTCPFSKRA